MSAKVTVKTSMKQADQIHAALEAMGVPTNQIQRHPEGREIDGYRGKKWGKAEIIIPKSWHNGYSDIGFVRQQDGTYAAVLDHIDEHTACRMLGKEAVGNTFSQMTGQWYAATAARKTLQSQGFQTEIRQDGKNLKVLAEQW